MRKGHAFHYGRCWAETTLAAPMLLFSSALTASWLGQSRGLETFRRGPKRKRPKPLQLSSHLLAASKHNRSSLLARNAVKPKSQHLQTPLQQFREIKGSSVMVQHIVFVNIPSAGHMNPTLPVVAELRHAAELVLWAFSSPFSKAATYCSGSHSVGSRSKACLAAWPIAWPETSSYEDCGAFQRPKNPFTASTIPEAWERIPGPMRRNRQS